MYHLFGLLQQNMDHSTKNPARGRVKIGCGEWIFTSDPPFLDYQLMAQLNSALFPYTTLFRSRFSKFSSFRASVRVDMGPVQTIFHGPRPRVQVEVPLLCCVRR